MVAGGGTLQRRRGMAAGRTALRLAAASIPMRFQGSLRSP